MTFIAPEISKADAPAEKSSTKPTSAKVKLPKSPIMGKSADQLGKDRTPPKIFEAPKPDPKVEPRPRKTAGKSESSQGQPKVTKPEPKPEAPKPKAESKEKPKVEKEEKSKN